MLYDLHEMQRAMMSPLTEFTEIGSKLFSLPGSPLAYSPMARQMAASYEMIFRLGKKYEKPAWDLPTTEVNGKIVGVKTENVYAKPFCKLSETYSAVCSRQLPRHWYLQGKNQG